MIHPHGSDSHRCILIQIEAKPTNINIIQVYAAAADKSLEELEKCYDVKQLLKYITQEQFPFLQETYSMEDSLYMIIIIYKQRGSYNIKKRSGICYQTAEE